MLVSFTSNKVVGLVVPIPTFPSFFTNNFVLGVAPVPIFTFPVLLAALIDKSFVVCIKPLFAVIFPKVFALEPKQPNLISALPSFSSYKCVF